MNNIIYFSSIFIVLLISSCELKKDNVKNKINSTSKKEMTYKKPTELDKLNQKIESTPTNALLYLKRGKYYLKNKDYLNANNDFADAYLLDSNNVNVMLVVADFLTKLGKIEESTKMYKKILNIKKENKEAYLGLAKIFYYIGNTDISFKYLDTALILDNKYRDAYFFKAMVFRNDGNLKKAISSYQTVLEQDPEYIPAFIALGNLFSKTNQEMAINYFNSALEVDSTNIEAIYAKAYFLQNIGENTKAIKMYDSMIKNDSINPNSYHNIGYIYLENYNQLDSAKKYFNKSIEVDSLFYIGYHNLGTSFARSGDVEKAKTLYSKALKINPNFELSKQELKSLN